MYADIGEGGSQRCLDPKIRNHSCESTEVKVAGLFGLYPKQTDAGTLIWASRGSRSVQGLFGCSVRSATAEESQEREQS